MCNFHHINHIPGNNLIRIGHGGEGWIEKCVPGITVWHHELLQTVIPRGGFFFPALLLLLPGIELVRSSYATMGQMFWSDHSPSDDKQQFV